MKNCFLTFFLNLKVKKKYQKILFPEDSTTGQNDVDSASIGFYFIKIGSVEPAVSVEEWTHLFSEEQFLKDDNFLNEPRMAKKILFFNNESNNKILQT